MSIIFVCKICKTKHTSTEVFENGVAKLPDSITTLKDAKSNWYFCCVNPCKEPL